MTPRLHHIFCLLAFIAVLGLAAPAQAATSSAATETIRSTVDELMNILKQPEMQDPAKRPAMLQRIEDKVQTIFDFGEFSMRTVGPSWRTFTPEQKQRFITAFAALLRASYIEKIDGYNGEQVHFTGEISSTRGDKVEVQTTIKIKDKIIPVSYRMLDKDSKWMVYDVLIEKVSLVETYRNQFRDLMAKGDPEALISRVESKAKEMREQNQKGIQK